MQYQHRNSVKALLDADQLKRLKEIRQSRGSGDAFNCPGDGPRRGRGEILVPEHRETILAIRRTTAINLSSKLHSEVDQGGSVTCLFHAVLRSSWQLQLSPIFQKFCHFWHMHVKFVLTSSI